MEPESHGYYSDGGGYHCTSGVFRSLNHVEVEMFKKWAAEHVDDEVNPIWHPVIQLEIARLRNANQDS